MKNFFIKLSVFLLILLALLLPVEYKLARMPNSYSIKKNCLENNIGRINLLILGSSQAHYGINPQSFSPYSCNLANSNQDLYYDSQILDSYLDKMKDLKRVFISLSYFSFEFRLKNTGEAWRQYFYYRFLGIKNTSGDPSDLKNYSLIADYTPKTTLGFLVNGFHAPLVENNLDSGWFKANPSPLAFDPETGKERARLHTSYMQSSLTENNLSILNKMIDKLQDKGVEVILITLPTTSTYYNNIDKDKYSKMRQMVLEVEESQKVQYLNYFMDSRFDTNDFADDSDHLNYIGSEKLSKMIKYDLEKITEF